MQVGASNELPESEELDALYDRFLLRRQVAQVSQGQLATLARLASGALNALPSTSNAASNGAPIEAALDPLTMPDFRQDIGIRHIAVLQPLCWHAPCGLFQATR